MHATGAPQFDDGRRPRERPSAPPPYERDAPGMRALGRGTVRPRNVYSRRRLPRRRANASPFTFITPSHNVRTRVSYRDERRSARERLRPLGYPATRAHVRLLGPCFKTGRKEARRFVADRRRRERYGPAETGPPAASITRAQSYRPRRKHRETRHRRATAETAAQTNLKRRSVVSTRRTGRDVRHPLYGGSAAEISNRREPGPRRNGARPESVLNSARPDSRALSVYPRTVSRTIELSLQSSFQLSLTVLVRYRSRGRI